MEHRWSGGIGILVLEVKWESFVKICREIEEFLRAHNEPDWSKSFVYLHKQASEVKDLESRRDLLSQARTIFGGMGSFNDLVIESGGQVSRADNRKLDEMRDSLYDIIMEMSGT